MNAIGYSGIFLSQRRAHRQFQLLLRRDMLPVVKKGVFIAWWP